MPGRRHAPHGATRAPTGRARSDDAASAPAALSGRPRPAQVIALQRAVGNANVGRLLLRSVSPPEAPGAQLPQMLSRLDPAVQAVLHRRGHARVWRPPGGWTVYQAADERIDFDWVALLFVLHRSDARSGAADYLTILGRLMVPAIQRAARDPLGRTPAELPNLDVLTAAMWARNPPPSVLADGRLAALYRQVMESEQVEGRLTEAVTRARQANITDQSIPGRRTEDYAFIMGPDEGPRARNQFYRTAGAYYRGRLPRDHVRHVASLEDVLDWIRDRARRSHRRGEDVAPLGTIYIVSHADELGSLSTNITRRGKHGFYPFELEAALGAQGNTWFDARGGRHVERLRPLEPDMGVDGWTRVFIRGCDLGREPRALNAMRDAFGGAPLVHAPKHAQYYGRAATRERYRVGEGLADTYSLEIPADERVDDAEIATRLAAKYAAQGIDEATFRAWLRLGRAGTDDVHSVSDYTVPWTWQTAFGTAADVPADRAGREAAIRQQIADDPERSRLIHFDQASWRFRVAGRTLFATGRIRYVHVHVVRRDAGGTLTQLGVRDREAYGVDVRPLGAAMTTVPWP